MASTPAPSFCTRRKLGSARARPGASLAQASMTISEAAPSAAAQRISTPGSSGRRKSRKPSSVIQSGA